jgi:iron complex transport system permease protein
MLALLSLALALFLVTLISLGYGPVSIPPQQVLTVLLQQIGITLPWEFEPQHQAVIMSIRLPRTMLGILVGAALAVSGAALQGLFRNPLADPALIGVSAGASLAAVSVIVLGTTGLAFFITWFGPFALPLAAFCGGFLATLLVYRLASSGGRTVVATMLLAGIAINAIAMAGVGLFIFVADDQQLRSLTFWNLGSLGRATWATLGGAIPLLLAPLFFIPRLARALNALLLGEAEAGHLGVDADRVKRWLVLWVALGVGAAVAVSGVIGFVGLVVPHLIRLALGPDHRYLLPGSMLLGATLLLGADLLARTVVAPAELPIGIVTSLLGGPFFLWLLLKQKQRSYF